MDPKPRRLLPSRGALAGLALAIGVAGVGLAVDGLIVEPRRLQRKTLEARLTGLPPALSGLTVLHLSDFHFTPRNRWLPQQLARLAHETQANPPDVIALTGDLVEWDEDARACAAMLAPLRSRLGSFAVLGNHDYGNACDPREQPQHPLLHTVADAVGGPLATWNGRPTKPWGNRIDVIVAALEDAGVRVLRNAAVALCCPGERLWVAGVDEPHQRRACPEAAFARIPPDEPVLLLTHSPEVLECRLPRKPTLILAGHTHGGQVRLPGIKPLVTHTRVMLPRYQGLIETDQGPMFITSGIGASVPLRFRCPPEIVTLVLRPAPVQPVRIEAAELTLAAG